MRRVAFVLIAGLSAPLAAQMEMPKEAPGKLDPSAIVAGSYKIDPAHSQVLFTVNHLGFTEYTGQFTAPTGMLVLDPAKPAAAKVDISFPIDKVMTTVPALDTHLKSADFFDAAKYPTARFVSTAVTVDGNMAKITGDLTLHGVTKPVTLDAHLIGAGKAFWGEKKTNVGFAATATIKRSDFGMGFDVPLVSDDVALTINAGFEAQ